MRIIVKILLTIVCLVLGVFLQGVFANSGGTEVGVVRLIPAIIMIAAIIGVWRYKPSKTNSAEKTDLKK